jgi:hypothetical protein
MELALSFPRPIFSWRSFDKFHRFFVLPLFLLVLIAAITLSGCSFASFVAAAEADVPVVITMIQNITNIVAPGVSPDIAAAGALALSALALLCGSPAIGAAVCDPSSLIGQYQASNSTDASVLAKIQAVLQTVNSHITAMLALAKGLPASIGASIVAAIGVALTTVTSLMSLVGLKAVYRTAAPTKQLLKTIPKPATLKSQFNAAIGTQYAAAMIH